MLDDIVLFINLYEFRSFKKCADFLKIKPSTLSKHITELEYKLEKRLIIRDPKNFEPTDFGKYIYNKFKHIPLFMEETINVYQKTPAENYNAATLNVALASVLAYGLICPQLNKFMIKYPKIKLNINFITNIVSWPNSQTNMVLSTDYIQGDNFNNRFMRTEHGKLFCSSSYAAKYSIPKHPTEINNQTLIGLINLNNIPLDYVKFKNIYSTEECIVDCTQMQLHLDNALHMKQIGLNSDYIFGSFEYLIQDELRQGLILPVLPNWVAYELNYYLVSKKVVSAEEQLFIDFIYECMKV
jgi:DNA-binding transcriptional LysR family regulator